MAVGRQELCGSCFGFFRFLRIPKSWKLSDWSLDILEKWHDSQSEASLF